MTYRNLVSSPLVQNRYIRMGRAKAKDVLTIRSEIYDFAKISE